MAEGTEAVPFTPFELIEGLLPLIPRPHNHTARFVGILAPAAGRAPPRAEPEAEFRQPDLSNPDPDDGAAD